MSSERHPFGEPGFDAALAALDEDVQQVVRLAAELCTVPGVTVPQSRVDFAALQRTVAIARRFAADHGLRVIELAAAPQTPYPFLIVTFHEVDLAAPEIREAVGLIGHLDVVPARDPQQFSPYVQNGELFARGAADMKTVVASYLVWLATVQRRPGPKPPLLLLLSCCEENGSDRPHNLGSVLDWLAAEHGVQLRFAIVGERTGELEWMDPAPTIGAICRENRAWRWLRLESTDDRGRAGLARVARAVRRGRTGVHELNQQHTPRRKLERQPGVRSGFVNPFAFVPGDPPPAAEQLSWLLVERPAGAAIHSAAAQAEQPSLVERFAALADAAADAFGADRVGLAGVEIGQDDNFNSYDGSGVMRLHVAGASPADWAARAQEPDLRLTVCAEPLAATAGPTVVGIDVRELLDHRAAVAALLDEIGDAFAAGAALARGHDLPAWRCPAAHPDLQRLEEAYREVVGAPSPDLVKLHGNDGGHLAARQQAGDPVLRAQGVGHAVVFGQVGKFPHGAAEQHRIASIRPYLDVLDRWIAKLG